MKTFRAPGSRKHRVPTEPGGVNFSELRKAEVRPERRSMAYGGVPGRSGPSKALAKAIPSAASPTKTNLEIHQW